MRPTNPFKPYWVSLLMFFAGILVGFWMIWPAPDRPDDFEELIRAPLAEEDHRQ